MENPDLLRRALGAADGMASGAVIAGVFYPFIDMPLEIMLLICQVSPETAHDVANIISVGAIPLLSALDGFQSGVAESEASELFDAVVRHVTQGRVALSRITRDETQEDA